jgi:hypothetical protein
LADLSSQSSARTLGNLYLKYSYYVAYFVALLPSIKSNASTAPVHSVPTIGPVMSPQIQRISSPPVPAPKLRPVLSPKLQSNVTPKPQPAASRKPIVMSKPQPVSTPIKKAGIILITPFNYLIIIIVIIVIIIIICY